MLEVNGWYKEAQRDNYENGLYGKYACCQGPDRFSASTVEALLAELQGMFWCDYYTIHDGNSLMMERWEDDNADKVMDSETDSLWQEFKRGETDLWCARYYFKIDEVERKDANLEEQEGYFDAST